MQRWTLFTSNCKTEELHRLNSGLTKVRKSIAAANQS